MSTAVHNRFPQSQLRLGTVCRGCLHLGLDIKLVQARVCQDFLTGLAGLDYESYKNGFLCYKCVRRMRKAVEFRDNVLRVNQILSDIATTRVSLQWLSETQASLEEEPLSLSETVLVECLPNEDDDFDWGPDPSDVPIETDEDNKDLLQAEVLKHSSSPGHADDENQSLEIEIPIGHRPESDESMKEQDALVETEIEVSTSPRHLVPDYEMEEFQPVIKAEDEGINFHCELCDCLISTRDKYQRHMDGHKTESHYRCGICSFYFVTLAELENHKRRHTMLFQCSLCEFKRRDKPQVMRHYAVNHIGLTKDLSCPYCGDDLSERLMCLKSHVCFQGRIHCEVCSEEFERIAIHQHEKIHKGDKKCHECDECGRKYRHANGLAGHKLLRHNPDLTAENSFYCAECDITLPHEQSYKRHLQFTAKHADSDKLMPCPHCPTRMLKPALKRHILREHLKVPPFKCPECPKSFFTKRGLKGHKDHFHLKIPRCLERKYTCETCGKGFTSKQLLSRHMNSHTGERKYVCVECGRGFIYDNNLYTHIMLVHRKCKRDKHGRFYPNDEDVKNEGYSNEIII